MKFVTINVEQSIEAPIRKATFVVDGLEPPQLNAEINIIAPDHLGANHCLFIGIIPDQEISIAPVGNKVTVTGYDYGINLSNEKWMIFVDEYRAEVKNWKLDNYIHWCISPFPPTPSILPTTSMSVCGYQLYTNIYPWRIPVAKVNITPAVDPNFSLTTTRLEIFKKLATDNNCLWHIKPYDVFNTGYYKCALYYILASDIDDSSYGLQLPTAIEFGLDSPYLASPLQIKQNENRRYNVVTVYGAEIKGTVGGCGVLDYTKKSPSVMAYEERPHTFVERDPSYDTVGKCQARAERLYTYYTSQSDTVIAKFINRTDLELYQRIKFTGLEDTRGNLFGWLRITSIKYSLKCGITEVQVECSNRVDLDATLAINTPGKNSTNTIKSIAKKAVEDNPNYVIGQLETYVGIVTAIDTGVHTATVYTELGKEIRNVRLPDQGG